MSTTYRKTRCGITTAKGRPCRNSKDGCTTKHNLNVTGASDSAPTRSKAPSTTTPSSVQGASSFVIHSGRYAKRGQGEHRCDIAEELGYGEIQTRVGIYDQMYRTVPAISQLYRVISYPIRSLNWGHRFPAKVRGDPRHIDLCNKVYFEDLEGGHDRFTEQKLKSLLYGFMAHETEDGVDADGNYVWKRFLQRMPWSVKHIHRHNERLAGITQRAQREDGKGVEELPINGDRLLWTAHDLDGDHFTGISILRPCFGPWTNIKDLWRYAGIRFARMATPLPVIHADDKVYQNTILKDDLGDTLENLIADINSFMVLPKGAEFAFVGGEVPSSDIIEMLHYYERTILSVGLAQWIGFDGGNRSVTDTQARAYWKSLKAVVRTMVLAENDTSEFAPLGSIKRLIDANFGPQKHYPQLYATVPRSDTFKGMADAMSALVSSGMHRPTVSDHRQMREEWDYPAMTPEEEIATQKMIDNMDKAPKPRGRGEDEEQPATPDRPDRNQ